MKSQTRATFSGFAIPKKHLLFPFLFVLLSNAGNAQSGKRESASAHISATVVSDLLGATEFNDMNFTETKTEKSGLKQDVTAIHGATSFKIISNNLSYSITISEDLLIKRANNNARLTESSVISKGRTVSDEETLVVNATLSSRTNSLTKYENDPLSITVNYN